MGLAPLATTHRQHGHPRRSTAVWRAGRAGPWLLAVLVSFCDDPWSRGSSPPPAPVASLAASTEASTAKCSELWESDPWVDRLGTHTLADRGKLLGCTHAAQISEAEVSTSPFLYPALGPTTSGYDLFVIQYVSAARPGVAHAATALVYLPTHAAAGLPIVAADSGMFGVGPSCGATHVPILSDALAVPLAARGHVVVAPDYTGVGIDNAMTSYLVGAVEAASTLDGVQAARQVRDARFEAARLATDLFVVGYSQGGHAALFAHQLYDSVPGSGVGLRLLGSIAVAPGLGSVQDWAASFTDPARAVRLLEIDSAALLHAHMLYAGAPPPGAWLSPAAQAALPAMLHDDCLPELLVDVAAKFPTVRDLYQPAFVAAAAGCRFHAGCPGFEPWASGLVADEPGRFSSAAPSLIVQGLDDPVVSPASTACIVDRMKARGTPVQACGYSGADHLTVLPSAMSDLFRWMAGRRQGLTPDVCRAPLAAACDSPEAASPD